MRNLLVTSSWISLAILFIPSFMIIASWQSLPDQGLYGVKIALEKFALIAARPSYKAETSLQLAYTDRRFTEAKSLLANKNSIQGLSYLSDQITATKDTIIRAPNKKTKDVLARLYMTTLSQVSSELEQQKQLYTASPAQKKTLAMAPSQPKQLQQQQQINLSPEAAQQIQSPQIPYNQQSQTSNPVTRYVREVVTKTITKTTTKTTSTMTKDKESSPQMASETIPTPTTGGIPTPTQTVVSEVTTTTTDIPTNDLMSAMQISQTQQVIQQTINELEQVTQETSTTYSGEEDDQNSGSGRMRNAWGNDRNNGNWKDDAERENQGRGNDNERREGMDRDN